MQVEARLPVALELGAAVTLKVEAGKVEAGKISFGNAGTGVATAGSVGTGTATAGQAAPRLSVLVDPQSRPLSGDVTRTVNAVRVQPGVEATVVSGSRTLPASGSVVTARFLSPAADGMTQLSIGKTVVKVPLATPPEPGSTVLVKIEGTGTAAASTAVGARSEASAATGGRRPSADRSSHRSSGPTDFR
ncbi:hypothetical protein [Breoghania sp.]|uniref:hypothetical protein n=1 Tax=Breoghania sp. TaxID=2065378 RepID=UPI00261C9CE3|nr:hypothetical protein [Breoghania sp.]MDJ0932215.1 hypothetical protein [Breoghania sp.]